MNIANILTCFRFVLIPVFVLTFRSEGDYKIWSAVIFIVASATDVLDGYLARKYDLVTNFGKLMDPLADKLMQITVLICLLIADIVPLWFILVLAAKELLLIAGSAFLYVKKTVVQSNIFGKLNTVFLFAAIILLLFFTNMNAGFKYVLLGICIALSVFAMCCYAYSYFLQSKKFKTYIGRQD